MGVCYVWYIRLKNYIIVICKFIKGNVKIFVIR